jgi:hypothetical protein
MKPTFIRVVESWGILPDWASVISILSPRDQYQCRSTQQNAGWSMPGRHAGNRPFITPFFFSRRPPITAALQNDG